MMWREGGCHCGRVRFKVFSDFEKVYDCNCSICTKKGFLHLIVPKQDFEILAGRDALSVYRFNTQTAKHYFCSQCGIAPFYVPRSHPDGFDVNLRCIDGIELDRVAVVPFDGQNWETNASSIQENEP